MPGSTRLLYCVEGGELETGGTSWVINKGPGQDEAAGVDRRDRVHH